MKNLLRHLMQHLFFSSQLPVDGCVSSCYLHAVLHGPTGQRESRCLRMIYTGSITGRTDPATSSSKKMFRTPTHCTYSSLATWLILSLILYVHISEIKPCRYCKTGWINCIKEFANVTLIWGLNVKCECDSLFTATNFNIRCKVSWITECCAIK